MMNLLIDQFKIQRMIHFNNPLSITFDNFRIITGCFRKAEMTYRIDNNPTETMSRSRGNFRSTWIRELHFGTEYPLKFLRV